MSSTLIFQIQNFLVYILITYGVLCRKNRQKHVKIMTVSIIWDFLLILQIELTRSAIVTTTKILDTPLLTQIHLFFAVSTPLLFIAMIITGRKLIAGNNNIRPLHKKLGWTTFFFRTAVLITSFWVAAHGLYK